MTEKTHGFFPIAVALREALQKGYNFRTFKSDVVAGLIVSLVALPLSMALSIAVGLPPQHGLYTAIAAGIVTPLLGGSMVQVSGPTAAFVVIVAPIVTKFGLSGLILTTLMAGFVLIIAGLARLGRYINYMPYPVTTGFTSGIAVVIGTLSLNDFLGLHIEALQGDYVHKAAMIAQHIPTLYWPEALVGIVSLVLMFTSNRILPKVPPSIVGIGIGTLLAWMLQRHGFDVATLGNRYTYALPGGGTGHGIPPFPPAFHIPSIPDFAVVKTLVPSALVIAALGALESLLSATVADGMAGTRHNPNAELTSIGIGNILSGLFSGIPATGAIARTATNIHGGAKTPFASSIHALLILAYVLLLAPAISYILMASLAALLLTVAYRMSHWRQFIRTVRIAPVSDTIVLIACFGFTVFIDMVAGVTVGVVLACFLLMKRISQLTYSHVSHNATGHHRKLRHLSLPDDAMVYHITGLVFFGTVENALERIGFVREDIKTLIIDMEDVPLIDMTGLVAMKGMILDLQNKNKAVILCADSEITHKILQKLPLSARHKLKTAGSMEEAVEFTATAKPQGA